MRYPEPKIKTDERSIVIHIGGGYSVFAFKQDDGDFEVVFSGPGSFHSNRERWRGHLDGVESLSWSLISELNKRIDAVNS